MEEAANGVVRVDGALVWDYTGSQTAGVQDLSSIYEMGDIGMFDSWR